MTLGFEGQVTSQLSAKFESVHYHHAVDFFVLRHTQCMYETKDTQHALCQLILLNGMMTSADQPGVEKLCCTVTQSSWLCSPLAKVRVQEDLSFEDGSLAGPGSVYMVKGWHRSICCLTVCYAAFMVPEMLEAGFFCEFL